MIISNIGFDIDGTLTNELEASINNFLEFYQKHYGEKYSGKIDMSKYELKERFPDCRDNEFMELFTSWHWEKYIRETPFRPFVKDLFLKLKQMGIKIHIVTARNSSGVKYTEDEIETITKGRFEECGIPVDEYHIGFYDKENVISGSGIELLVEDSPEQIWKVSEKIPVFVMDTPYNRDVRGKNIWRIHHFNPIIFIENLKYTMNHVDNWDLEYTFESGPEKRQGIEYEISEPGVVVFNKSKRMEHNSIFVIPFRPTDMNDPFSEKLSKVVKNPVLVRLSLIDKKPDEIVSNDTDELIIAVIRKFMIDRKWKNVDLTDTNSTKAYMLKCEIIKELLNYANSHKNKTFIFDGVQSMILCRDLSERYKENLIYITGASEKDIKTISHNRYRKGYNPWILMEDLTEVSTQLRKWKIIAGTAKKELPNYINRQNTTSEGIDMVSLLPGEVPYRPELLENILSMDTFLLGDCHLSTKDKEKTDRIISAINRTCKKDDHLLFLGDFDGKKGTGSYQLTQQFLKKLKCKNVYLILGNNDPYSIKDYQNLGFLSVTDVSRFQESSHRVIILTHCPYPVSNGEVNIHGHIHGSRCYWNMDWKNHYDVWDEDFVPIKIRDCLDALDKGLYIARSENHNIH